MSNNIGNRVGLWLKERGVQLATAESCTGGLVGHLVTSVAGSSAYYVGGVVSYSNEIKEGVLGVSRENLDKYGAVSEAVVREMAEGVRKLMRSDYGVATSGIAGPGGGSAEKPVGTVWICVAGVKGSVCKCLSLRGDRLSVIGQSAEAVLEMLIREGDVLR